MKSFGFVQNISEQENEENCDAKFKLELEKFANSFVAKSAQSLTIDNIFNIKTHKKINNEFFDIFRQ